MPLLLPSSMHLDSHPLNTTSPHTLYHSLLTHPSIHHHITSLLHQPLYKHTNERIVYIHQREWGCTDKDECDLIGSADATTCVIVTLHSPLTGRTCVAHLDGADEEIQIFGDQGSVLEMIQSFSQEELKAGLDLHLVGGFLISDTDESILHSGQPIYSPYTSIPILLLHLCMSCDVEICIRTWCVGSLNSTTAPCIFSERGILIKRDATSSSSSSSSSTTTTTTTTTTSTPVTSAITDEKQLTHLASLSNHTIRYPLVTSIYINPTSGVVYLNPIIQPQHRGPDMSARFAACCYAMNPQLIPIYTNNTYTIAPFSIYKYALSTCHPHMSDAEILKNSTSPLVEGPQFCPDMRAAMSWMLQYGLKPDAFWEHKHPRRYRRQQNGDVNMWERIKE